MTTKSQTPCLLVQAAVSLRSSRPEDQRIRYDLGAWVRVFPEDPDLAEIRRRFGDNLSRGNLFDLGREAKGDAACVRRFFLAIMMWGYGMVGYGATRTGEMLAHPRAVERLIRGADVVRAGDLVEACLFFRDRSRGYLPKFSWSFFTKYFYFVGIASDLQPMPLILDGISRSKGAAGGMQRIADAGDLEAVRAMDDWWTASDQRCARGYALYVNLVNRWANDLGCRPDAIEMALWQGMRF